MTRRLGRTDIEVPPIIWQIGGSFDRSLLEAAQATWVLVSAGEFAADLRGLKAIVAIEADRLRPRSNATVEFRLKELGLTHCTGILIQGASADDVKSGWPFHRLLTLRENGLTQLAMIEAQNIGDAQWLVENAPAHAVALPYGIDDLSAGFRLLDSAMEVGTAILATRPTRPVWTHVPISSSDDLRFRLADPRIAAAIEPLPTSAQELSTILQADPLPAPQRDEWWQKFSAQVAPPPPLKGGHPPEYGA